MAEPAGNPPKPKAASPELCKGEGTEKARHRKGRLENHLSTWDFRYQTLKNATFGGIIMRNDGGIGHPRP